MKKADWLKLPFLVATFCMAAAAAAPAQTFKTLLTFNEANGAVPTAEPVPGSDGKLYGTTQYGGASDNGEIYRMSTSGGLTVLYSACSKSNCADGSLPTGSLVLGSDGNFYGTTSDGGSQGKGTIFVVTTSGSLTTLYSFCALANCTDGEFPYSGLVQGSDGNFYGTTPGGAESNGTAFRITPSGTLTSLHTFCSVARCGDGTSPEGGVIQGSDGNFYGTTAQAGANGNGGTVFRLTPGGALTTLYSFCARPNCADGQSPYAGLWQGSDGNFYGTTVDGGTLGKGTIFRITPTGVLTTLYNFCSIATCTDGEYPYGGVVQASDGNLYGTTQAGGVFTNANTCPFGCGTFFRLTLSGTLTTLYNFCSGGNCLDGAQPFSGLALTSNGTIYGTTAYGGVCSTRTEGCGTVFAWSPNVLLPPTLSPTSVNFGNFAIDTTENTRTITVKNVNTGLATLDIASITLSGSTDFAIVSNSCGSTLAAGKACSVGVNFTPTVLGAESGTLKVVDNAPGPPQTVAISGTGVAQTVVTPSSLTYSKQKVGTTSIAKNVTLKNDLATTLSGIAFKATKPFAVSTSTCAKTLNSTKTCTISVTFTPTVTGAATGTLTIVDSANNSPQTVSLTGTGD